MCKRRLHNLLKVNPRPRVGGDAWGKGRADADSSFNLRPRVGGDCLFIIFSAEGMQVGQSLFYSVLNILY